MQTQIESFGKLNVNKSKGETFNHVFNPYNRRRPTHKLDDVMFKTVCNAFHTDCGAVLDHFFDGCLDAPDDIPMGSTLCVDTIGGYRREEYNNLPRGTEDWKARARAKHEVAKMLADLLNGIDDD